jgi:hypothetical protein
VRFAGSLGAPLGAAYVAKVTEPWPSSWPANVSVALPGVTSKPVSAIYYVEARSLRHDAQGVLRASMPACCAAVTRDPGTKAALNALSHSAGSVTVPITGLEDPNGNTVADVTRVRRATNRHPTNEPPIGAAVGGS